MKNKKYINNFLLIGILFMSALFIIGCSERILGTGPVYSKSEAINSLDTINKQKYKELERQKYHIESQVKEYATQRSDIIITKLNSGTPLDEESDKKFQKDVDNLDIKINQAANKRDSIQAKMDAILAESTKTCFPKNTKVVMFDGSLKDIDTIVKGDKVMIYDIANDVISESTVNKKFINTNNHLYIINDNIKTTSYERFLTKDGWKRTHDLSTKDSIFNGNSFVKVDSIYKVKKDLTVYNLNINSTHNFFVSSKNNDEWFLIHNCGGGGGK